MTELQDPPTPDLDELQQRDPIEVPMVPVPVVTTGPVRTQALPSRSGPAFEFPLSATLQDVLGADLKRAVTILIGSGDWSYARTRSGTPVRWPSGVPLVLTHADAVAAKASGDGVILSVITEIYAD